MNTEALLDTSNRHCFVYTSEELRVEILGGIRGDLLDLFDLPDTIENEIKGNAPQDPT
ncbi:MAG TPA: hypothetical protein VGM30_10795 [Puia sp.]|jgi:hypothetical protein